MNWKHDCQSCICLGSDSEADYYFHPHTDPYRTTLISRYGEDGNYSSGFEFLMSNPYLNTALRLAFEQNVLSEEVKEIIKNNQRKWFKYCEEDIEYKISIGKRWENKERFILK